MINTDLNKSKLDSGNRCRMKCKKTQTIQAFTKETVWDNNVSERFI